MKEKLGHIKRPLVPRALREEIKHGQGCACGVCQRVLDERKLEIHHIKPVCHFKRGQEALVNQPENLIAVCDPCHEALDTLALKSHIYFSKGVDMQPDIEYMLEIFHPEVTLLRKTK